ncbi:MAG: MXAN_5187 C-terminal domain-containing protein [Pyrinomonadaceae bacterium]
MAINNNRFARQAELNINKRDITGEEKVTLDQQLIRLEEDIRRLKIEYDIYFNGAAKRAPYDTKNRVETMLKRLGDERSLSFAQRYQYNTLTARFTAFRELWRRTLREREEGRDSATLAKVTAQAAGAGKPKQPQQSPTASFICANVKDETQTVQAIYQALINAQTACGENAKELTFSNFQAQLTAQTERFKQSSGCEKVSFEVGALNGRVIFKAKAEK